VSTKVATIRCSRKYNAAWFWFYGLTTRKCERIRFAYYLMMLIKISYLQR